MFIMNMKGTLDENQLNDLHIAKKFAERLTKKNNNTTEEELIKDFPYALWVIRDFTLRMVDENGEKITSKIYLENALKEMKGSSDKVHEKNSIRRCIKECFKQRDCFTLIRPVEDEQKL